MQEAILREYIPNSISIRNITLADSDWECDLLRVTRAGYATEFEIKRSVQDFRADFNKTVAGTGMAKHDAYSSEDRVFLKGGRREVFRPAHFFFVVPEGLLDGVSIPGHCGLIECRVQELPFSRGRHCVSVIKKRAPRLKNPTRITRRQMWNICIKACDRLVRAERSCRLMDSEIRRLNDSCQ